MISSPSALGEVTAAVAIGFALTGCSTDYCPQGAGCINEKFIAELEKKCRFAGEQGCRLSFKDAVGDVENVYFVGTLGARLDECTRVSVSDSLKRSYTPLCQYVLFEKRKQVAGFNPSNTGFFSRMDASKTIVVKKIPEDRASGSKKYFYTIELPSGVLEKWTAREDKCIGPR